MRTVELLLDDAADADVRAAWRELAATGRPSQAAHRSPTNAPHVTVASCPVLTPPIRAGLAAALDALPLCVAFEPRPLRFTGRTQVLAWGLEPTPELLALHTAVWDTLTAHTPPDGLNPLHAPERWVPHVTLGRTRRTGAYADAEVSPPPPSAWLVAARSFDTETHTLEPLTV